MADSKDLTTPNATPPLPAASSVPGANDAAGSIKSTPPPPTPESTQVTLHEGTAPQADVDSTSPLLASAKPRGIFSRFHFGPRAIAAIHSAYVTATAMAGGLVVAAVEQGGARDLHGVLVYAGHNWLQALVPMIVAPAYRAARVNTQTAQVVAAGQIDHKS